MIINDEVNRVFITGRDILTNEGYHYLETVFNTQSVEIITVKQNTEDWSVQ